MWPVRNQMVKEDHHRISPVTPETPVADRDRHGVQQRLQEQLPCRAPKRMAVALAPRRKFLFHLQQILGCRTSKQFAGTMLRSFRHCSMREVAKRGHDEVGTHHISLQRQALQIVQRLDRNQRGANYASHIYLGLDAMNGDSDFRSEEHTSELQSHSDLVCRL